MTQRRQTKQAIYGGPLMRDFGNLPGLLEKFVTVSRRYSPAAARVAMAAAEAAFGRTNAEPITDDLENVFPAGALLHLGSDGREDGKKGWLFVHKFLPVAELYPPTSFDFTKSGERF